jgi:hypothetical protein
MTRKCDPEQVIEDRVIKRARDLGYETRKVQWIGRRGAPDRFFWHKEGRRTPFFIEFKAEDGALSANQEREIAKMRAGGIEVHVIDNMEDGYDLLR